MHLQVSAKLRLPTGGLLLGGHNKDTLWQSCETLSTLTAVTKCSKQDCVLQTMYLTHLSGVLTYTEDDRVYRADDTAMPIYSVLSFQLFLGQIHACPVKDKKDQPADSKGCVHCLNL